MCKWYNINTKMTRLIIENLLVSSWILEISLIMDIISYFFFKMNKKLLNSEISP